jgi:trigger factor
LNISQESTGHLTAQIHVHLDPEDYKGEVQKELRKYAKQANMPGFRPGKVPVGMVKKMVGKSVVVEEVNKKVSSELSKYIVDNELNLLGNPMPTHQLGEEDFDVDCTKEMDFTFEVGMAPEFEISYDFPEAPVLYDINIDEDFLQEELDQQRDRYADVTNPEEVAEGDIIYGSVSEVDEEGNDVEEGFQRMVSLNPVRIENEDFFKPYIGKKLEERIPIDLFVIREDPAEVAKMLFIEEDELLEQKGKSMVLTLKRLNRVEKAPMDAEFFTKVAQNMYWQEQEFETEEAFLDQLREHMATEMKESAKWYFRNEAQKKLLEVNTVELPDEFLKKWILENEERYKSEEEVEEGYAEYAKSIKWSLLVEKMQENNEDMKVEREDLEESVRDSIAKSFQARGEELNEEMIEEYVNYTMGNQEMIDMHYRRLTNDRLYEFLEEKIESRSESIEATAFNEMQKKEREAAG